MKNFLIALIGLMLFCSHPVRSQITVRVEPSETVELITVMMYLTGHPAYNQRSLWTEYRTLLDSEFGGFRDHSSIRFIQKLRDDELINTIDLPAEIAVNSEMRDGRFYHSGEITTFEGMKWKAKVRRQFIREVNKFYRDSGFSDFYRMAVETYKPFQEVYSAEYLPKSMLTWIEEFVPVKDSVLYHLNLSFVCGGCNYGVPKGGIPNPVMGIFNIDEFLTTPPEGVYTYSTLALHEFMHPFCNPLIDRYYTELHPYGKTLYPVEEDAEGPYPTWKIALYESFVRATVVAFMQTDDFLKDYVDMNLEEDMEYGFYWVGDLAELLLKYQAQRDKYPTLDSFMPEIVNFYNELAATI